MDDLVKAVAELTDISTLIGRLRASPGLKCCMEAADALEASEAKVRELKRALQKAATVMDEYLSAVLAAHQIDENGTVDAEGEEEAEPLREALRWCNAALTRTPEQALQRQRAVEKVIEAARASMPKSPRLTEALIALDKEGTPHGADAKP